MKPFELYENNEDDASEPTRNKADPLSDSPEFSNPDKPAPNQETNDQLNPLDKIISQIGIGKYHYFIYITMGIFFICDGAEIIAISFLSVILEELWDLTDNDIGTIGTAIFGGFFIGSLLSGLLAEKLGRRKLFFIATLLNFILCLISALAPNFQVMLISRALYGIAQGIIAPLITSILTEITPVHMRGKVMVIASGCFTIGEMLACLIVVIALNFDIEHNWRVLLLWSSAPAGLSFLIACLVMKESPRFAIFKEFEFGLDILSKINRFNKKEDLVLVAEEKQKLKEWLDLQKTAGPKVEGFWALLSPLNRWLSVKLWFMWFVLSFSYYGIVYVFPMALSAESDAISSTKDVGNVFVSVLGEIPSYIICYLSIEHSGFGRKNSMILSYFVAGVACAISFCVTGWLFTTMIFFAKMAANAAFVFIYPYTSEVYHTKYRTTGIGVSSAMSRIGGAMMPWLALGAFQITPKMPFMLFGIACLFASIVTWKLPYDTQGRALDQLPVDTKLEQKIQENEIQKPEIA